MSQRSVFEEVGDAVGPATGRPTPVEPERASIARWLILLALLVAAMVVIGGATRLTDSGLSITEWAPVMGTIPPLGVADWEAAFAAYQQTTEFQEQNNWMTLTDFKPIYWWEWGHRFLGRLVGIVWLAGFLWFLLRGAIPSGWSLRLLLPGLLGGLQGAIGWWMVSSGLTDRLDVAPYRLAVHLGLAFVIFALLLWYALRITRDEVATLQARRQRIRRLMLWINGLAALVFLQVLSGALVAGLDAGRGYIDWPLMEGRFLPAEAFEMSPVWLNIFENPALAQFDHRMLAYLIVIVTVLFVIRAQSVGHAATRRWVRWVGMAVIFQAVIGIATVMHASPLSLALIHQGMALVLIAIIVRTRFEVAYPSQQQITA